MGFGETHWNRWGAWYRSASATARASYQAHWPEVDGWEGFYAFLDEGTLPPHLVEHQRRIAEASHPPAASEREIVDPYRVQWMLTDYLKRPSIRVRALKWKPEGIQQILRDPDGNAWCFSDAGNGMGVRLCRYDDELVGEDNLVVPRPLG